MRLFKYYKPMQLFFFLICFLWLYYVYVFLCINGVHIYYMKMSWKCLLNELLCFLFFLNKNPLKSLHHLSLNVFIVSCCGLLKNKFCIYIISVVVVFSLPFFIVGSHRFLWVLCSFCLKTIIMYKRLLDH